MAFTHLHVHSQHSFLDGVPTLPGLVERVVELGQSSIAITDHGEVSGHLKFQKAARDYGISPIFGMEGYFVDDVSSKDAHGRKGRDYDHITLLANSQVGLENLWKISSRAYIEGFYYKPRLDYGILRDHAEGIIATGGCLGGCVATYLQPDKSKLDPARADDRISRLVDILGERFYLELHTFPDETQRAVNKALVAKSAEFGVPLIAVSDSHYLRPEDWQNHEMLIAAQMKMAADDPKRYRYGPGALHVLSEDEVRERLVGHLDPAIVEQAIANTVSIAESAEGVTIEGQRTYPVFLDSRERDEDKLRRDAEQRYDARIDKLDIDPADAPKYRERLQTELNLVIDKGYAGYFLIIADVINWAKEQNILIGPGRGSAGGSLLSYVLGITEIDPIQYGLLFERFLDPQQTALPDIDVDVPQQKRQQVLEYLGKKYKIATIGTLTTLAPKVLLNDFCRLLGIDHSDNDTIGRIISATPDLAALDIPWFSPDPNVKTVRTLNAEALAPWERKYPKLFELMDAFTSHYRQAGLHAAGTVVNRESLMGKLPLRARQGVVSTQFPQEDVEELGYLKMDFLGLRTLSTLEIAHELAVRQYGDDAPKNYYDWQYDPYYYDDREAYESLWGGRNVGVFQLDTEGFARIITRYRPANMEDMCATVSLFRPGVTRAIDPDTKLNLLEVFLQKREGRIPVTYRHDLLRPILEKTYGSFLYQEQVMQVCRDLADFTPEEQTKLRKIIGKTKPEEMNKFKDKFIERASLKGVELDTDVQIWNDIQSFGVYGFNKSHGLAYGMVTHWTAFMKKHYPGQYLTACFMTDEENIKLYNRECRRLGVSLLGPDVNESEADFAYVNESIRYGIHGIKYVAGSSKVVRARRPYSSVDDFMTKMDGTKVNKRVIESLVLVGALDSIVRDTDYEHLPDWSYTKIALWRLFVAKLNLGIRASKKYSDGREKDDPRGQTLRDELLLPDYIEQFEEYASETRVDDREYNEVLYLGENVTTLPFGRYLPTIEAALDIYKTKGVPAYLGVNRMAVGQEAMIGGVIKEVRRFKVRKDGPNQGREMCSFMIEHPIMENDEMTDIEVTKVVVFPKEFHALKARVQEDTPVMIRVTRLKGDGGICLNSLNRIDDSLVEHAQNRPSVQQMRQVNKPMAHATAAEGYWD